MANFLTRTMGAITNKLLLWGYDAEVYKPEYLYNHYLNSNSGTDDQNILNARGPVLPRVRELYRNNLLVRSIINTIADNVVSAPFHFFADIPGDTPEIIALNDLLEKDWCQKFAPNMGGNGANITIVAETMLKRWLADGDSFGVVICPEEGNNKYKTRLRLIDQSYIQNPSDDTNKNIDQGIEKNIFGDKIKVYFTFDNNGNPIETNYTFTASDGYPQVIQLLDQTEGVGITRGAPLVLSAYQAVLEANEFEKSELNAAFFASKLNVIWKTNAIKKKVEQFKGYQRKIGASQGPTGSSSGQDEFVPILAATPGQITMVSKEDDISQFKFDRPQGAFDAYLREKKRNIASSVGFSYEFLWHDVRDFNGAGARFNSKTDQQKIKKYQQYLIDHFYNVITKHFVREFFAVNEMPLPKGMDLDDVCACIKFIPPKFVSVDEQKDCVSTNMKIEQGTSNLQIECMALGLDYEAVARQRKREKDLYKLLGLTDDTNLPDDGDNDKEQDMTPTGEVAKSPGEGPGKIASQDSTRVL